MQQANGVDEEIKDLYSAGCEIDLAYVESEYEHYQEAPELSTVRA
jgi:hypothetical protein